MDDVVWWQHSISGHAQTWRVETSKAGRIIEVQKLEDHGEFEDMTHLPTPPEEEEKDEEIGWQPQEQVIVQKKGGRPKNRAKEIAKSLRGFRKVQRTIKKNKERGKGFQR